MLSDPIAIYARVTRSKLSGGRLKNSSSRRIRSILSLPFSRSEAASWVLFSCLAAYTGPFGTYSLSLGWRLLYWTLVVVISAAMGSIFLRLSWALLGPGRRAARDLLTAVLMTMCFTPVLIWLSRRFLSEEFSSAIDAFYFAQYVAIITLGVLAGRRVLPDVATAWRSDRAAEPKAKQPADAPAPAPAAAAEPVPDPAPEPSPQPRLMRRLPEGFAGPILRLTSEDHFVDVVAPDQTVRLRMRLADAVDEMDPVEGFCTHRSHWVVRDAIDGVERGGGRVLLRMSNGDLVPVSRTYRPKLLAAGIL